MATHAAPPQSSILPHVHVPPPAHTAYNIYVPIEIVCSSRSIMKMVINTYMYMCVFVSACVCVCVRVRVVACAVSALMEGGRGGWTAFSSISKFRTLQSAGRGYLNISLKCGSSFRLSPFCFSIFFLCHVRLCVCVSDLFMFIFEA